MLPFSQRLSAAAAAFQCIGVVASVTGIGLYGGSSLPTIPATVAQLNALAAVYGQLINTYPKLYHQDVANQQAVLNTIVNTLVTTVTSLVATLNSMTAGTPDQAVILKGYQITAANALTQLTAVQSAQTDGE